MEEFEHWVGHQSVQHELHVLLSRPALGGGKGGERENEHENEFKMKIR
jgi:hypothetical protein